MWLARRSSNAGVAWVAGIGGGLILVGGIMTIGVYTWALTATDTSQLARALVWGDSGFGGQDQFPFRTVSAAVEPVTFRLVSDSPVAGYTDQISGASLPGVVDSSDTTAFIVIHGDDLLYEQYSNGSSRTSVQTSFSVAKSFTATLVGIAIDEGLITSLDNPITGYLPEMSERDPRFDDITLRHLITMSSGLSFRDGSSPWADPANTYYGIDLRLAALTEPQIADSPGTVFHYNDWNVILLGMVLERVSGMPVSQYLETRLWQPMGAEADGSWSLDSDLHGFEKMFVGVNGQAIDFAKLGWLYLNEGRNGSRAVVSSEFVAAATKVDTATDPSSEYQYLWWLDHERSAYFAQGDHGQFIYVDPNAQMVVVRHGKSLGGVNWIEFIGNLIDWLEPQVSSP